MKNNASYESLLTYIAIGYVITIIADINHQTETVTQFGDVGVRKDPDWCEISNRQQNKPSKMGNSS